MKKVVVVAHDVGPCHSLMAVSKQLETVGCTVSSFLGWGKHLTMEARDNLWIALQNANWLIVGTSSRADGVLDESLAVEVARRRKVRVAVFSEVYGAYTRDWVTDTVGAADILFVTDESDLVPARKRVREGTEVVVASNPYWEEFFRAQHGRTEVRAGIDMPQDARMVLVSGSKEPERNLHLFGDLVAACASIEEQLHLVVSLHPGALHPQQAYEGVLRTSQHAFTFLGKHWFAAQEVVGAADLVITGGGSSITLMAACQRVPVIDHMRAEDVAWWESLSGMREWPPALSGLSGLTATREELERKVRALLFTDEREAMIERQKELCPPGVFAEDADVIVYRIMA